ncbi:MAG: hypothetical protein IPJ77_14945 [Planctomycetes bacterium]|nr:hypothetical protein [Planctomycetota bacterium]
MESIAELRQRVQAPVRKYNDVAGVLVGDRVSIHVTRVFVQLGLSPTIATLGMLLFGVAGSAMVPLGGAWAVFGFACVFLYYILDCVDGEVARYHKREKLIFGFHDFMFHLYVKSAFFTCLGIYLVRTTGASWTFFFALAALLAVLFQKFLHDLPLILTARYILLRRNHERDHFVAQITQGAVETELAHDGALPDDHRPVAYSGPLSFVRAAVTNFDLGVLLFLVAAIADLFVEPFQLAFLPANCVGVLVVFYGIVCPFDFLDHLQTHIRNQRFVHESRRLLRGAHHFDLDG